MADVDGAKFDEERRERSQSFERGDIHFSSGPTIQQKALKNTIRDKHKQFSNAGAIPGMLVVCNDHTDFAIRGFDVSTVLEGWPQISVSLNHGDSSPSRASDGKSSSPVSAIGLVRFENADYRKSGLESFANRVLERYMNSAHAFELIEKARHDLRAQGWNFERKDVYLEIYRNRFATTPWPFDFVGPLDRVFDVTFESMYPKLVLDKQEPLKMIPIPKSDTQATIDALMNDPLLRNE